MPQSDALFNFIADDLLAQVSLNPAIILQIDATWNLPAQQTKRTLEAIRDKCCPRVKIMAMDVDDPGNMDLAASLGVLQVPSFAVFVDGERTELINGSRDAATLKQVMVKAESAIPWYW